MSNHDRILIIDDHSLFVEGLRQLLATQGFGAVDIAHSVSQGLELVTGEQCYRLVLLDLNFGESQGFEFLQTLNQKRLHVATVIISASTDKTEILQAINLGALGFIPKHMNAREFMAALQKVLQGHLYLPDEIWQELDSYPGSQVASSAAADCKKRPQKKLGDRQQQVVDFICLGLSNNQIAKELNIRETTVKYHVSKLLKLYGVKNRMGLINAIRSRQTE